MTEAELFKQLKELKQIRPDSEWVVLTKSRIFADFAAPEFAQPSVQPATMSLRNMLSFFNFFHPKYRTIAVPIFSLAVLLGIFSFARVTVPGDLLYPVKRAAEATQINFAAEEQKSKIHLEFANNRLEELNSIAQTDKIKSLAPSAISEFQTNITEAAKNLSYIKEPQNHPEMIKEVVGYVKKIKENKIRLEAVLAGSTDVGGTEELDNALAKLAEKEIEALEKRILTEEQEQALVAIKEDYGAGNYDSALEKLILINNQ